MTPRQAPRARLAEHPTTSPTTTPAQEDSCPTCGAPAAAWGEPILLVGSAIVSLQRYRCVRAHAHWWDRSRVLVDGVGPT